MKISARAISAITLIVYWGPSNALFYAWGFLLLSFLLIVKPGWIRPTNLLSKNILICVAGFILVMFISCAANFNSQNSSLNNFFWTLVTYGSTLCTLIVFINLPFRDGDHEFILKFSIILTLFQVCIGYFQMVKAASFQSFNPFSSGFDGAAAAGDFFVGTTFDVGIGNEVAIKISLTALSIIPVWLAKKNIKNSLILVVLILGWILPSAIYTLMAGLITIFYYYFFEHVKKAIVTARLGFVVFVSLGVGAFFVVLFIFLQPNNINYVRVLLKRSYDTAVGKDIPNPVGKIHYYKETVSSLIREYPHVLITGIGPGNYSSRSAWLVSGAYLEQQPDYIPVTPAKVAQEYTLTFWRKEFITKGFPDASSISYHPFSSWLSVFAEFGLIGLLFFIGIFFFLSRIIRQGINGNFSNSSKLNFSMGTQLMLTYISIIMFIDNLFEWPLVMGQFFVFVGIVGSFGRTSGINEKHE